MIGGNQSRRGSGGCLSPQRGCQGAAPLVGGSGGRIPPEAPAFAGIENLKILLSGRVTCILAMHAMAMPMSFAV